ncbi:hypothetical protein ABZ260_37280 [Streptosporangium sp. NPDC006013]|uniref:hypothetical protein n=1 Tax=Streptosporangium sp. NPDC006013 TaxID=3155596 RepID=UPI0033B8BF3B
MRGKAESRRPDLVTALALINTGPRMDAFIAQGSAIGPSQWPRLTGEQIRQAMSTAFSRADHQIPQQLVDDVRGMTYHAFTATMQASSDYLERQALPDRRTVLGKPLLVIFGEEDRRWRSSPSHHFDRAPRRMADDTTRITVTLSSDQIAELRKLIDNVSVMSPR